MSFHLTLCSWWQLLHFFFFFFFDWIERSLVKGGETFEWTCLIFGVLLFLFFSKCHQRKFND